MQPALMTAQQVAALYTVNLPGKWEIIRSSLYDSAAYIAAGQPVLTFFQIPQGAGTGFGGGVKTASDTNMTAAGQVPNMQNFLVTDIEVQFWPTTPTSTHSADLPAAFGAEQACNLINDAYIFRRSGNLNFFIGSKSYLLEGPLAKFPPACNFELWSALSDVSSTAADKQARNAFADVKGDTYSLGDSPVMLTSNQNFNVTLNWPEGNQQITNAARIFVSLNGWLMRAAQ